MMAVGVDGMIASGSAIATADLPKYNFFSGQFAYNARDYTKANARFSEAERLGYTENDIFILNADSLIRLKRPVEAFPYIDRAIAQSVAAGKAIPESWYAKALQAALDSKMKPEIAKWSRLRVKAYPTPQNWRDSLFIYRDTAKTEGQLSLDIMRLMRTAKALTGERDYFEYASLAIDRALPGEAKSAIEEGFASGAVNKSSRAVNEVLAIATGKITADRASLAVSEKQAAGSANGKIASGTADGYLGYGDDAKAITLYKLALTKSGIDPDAVNTRLGIALARSGQKEGARAAFALVKGPRAEIASFWNLWLDTKP
jgi:hypothetical protein